MVLVDGTRSAGSPTAPSPLVGAASTPAPATLLPVPFPVLLPDHRRGMKPGTSPVARELIHSVAALGSYHAWIASVASGNLHLLLPRLVLCFHWSSYFGNVSSVTSQIHSGSKFTPIIYFILSNEKYTFRILTLSLLNKSVIRCCILYYSSSLNNSVSFICSV
jgi:hypothetical protein